MKFTDRNIQVLFSRDSAADLRARMNFDDALSLSGFPPHFENIQRNSHFSVPKSHIIFSRAPPQNPASQFNFHPFTGFLPSLRSKDATCSHTPSSLARVFSGDENGSFPKLNDEVLGLVVFKSSLVDPRNYLESWKQEDEFPCSWNYVECDTVSRRVTAVNLDGLGLTGELVVRGLEKLQFLRKLSLAGNNFFGGVNPEFFLLQNLENLNISGNNLSGNVPFSVSSLPKIQFLDFSGNLLSGSLPDNLFDNCSSLLYLSFAGNRLEGQIPSSLRRCSALNHLNFSGNRFSGDPDFSHHIWTLTRLERLDLSNNMLSGSIPGGISSLLNLKELDLHDNQLSGSLPEDLGMCQHMNQIDLSKNQLTNWIPDSLQMLKNLKFLNLSNNLLTGNFPQWIDQMSALEYMDFSNNALTGALPSSMAALRSLVFLSLSNNHLSGAIPGPLVESSSLSVVRLSRNRFNGSIPENLFDRSLDELDLSRNELSGSIPPASSKLLDSLKVLDLSANYISGRIPAEMGLLSKLTYLNLSYNQLKSNMPPAFGYFPNLTVLDLRSSSLIGLIPRDICESDRLNILQLDGNSLTGHIPHEIGNCSSLFLLSLSHNKLTGLIPESLSQLTNLKVLKLEANQLMGEIPQLLGRSSNLVIANFSQNRLSGRLPHGGIFQTLDASAMEGNLGLCSPLLKQPCLLDVPKPLVLDPYAYESEGENKHMAHGRNPSFFSVSSIVAISAAAMIAIGVVIITLINVKIRSQISVVESTSEAGKLIFFDSNMSLDLHSTTLELVLNKSSEIGEGVFGMIYKADVGGQGTMVAIKKLRTSQTLQDQEAFDREIRFLAKAKHFNLNPLRGYYWTPELQLIVSEFAAGGNLESKLHDLSTSRALSWPERLKIVIGTAKGLAYLHHSFQPPIIHYNIKASNILLDENLNPKISDFGLPRLLTRFDSHIASNGYRSAPELACRNLRVNEKCDVYGFGILILEVVTGKQNAEEYVRELLERGRVLDCVDKEMGQYNEEEVLPLIKLALVCTCEIPSSRPSMAEVVQILQVIKEPMPGAF